MLFDDLDLTIAWPCHCFQHSTLAFGPCTIFNFKIYIYIIKKSIMVPDITVFNIRNKLIFLVFRIQDGPVTCISLTDTQMIVGGSSIGSITVSDLSSAQRVATLKSFGSAG